VQYLIGIPLIAALLLSVLNAIMGVGRSLFQASEDRLLPKFFAHKNKHHATRPGDALQPGLLHAGRAVRLAGAHLHLLQRGLPLRHHRALYGYFFVRQFRKELISPFRLPAFFRWIALAMAVFLTFVYFVGGWGSPDIVVGPVRGPSSSSSASSSSVPMCPCTSGAR
jgi:hypothetical protein